MKILVANLGSTSFKYRLYDMSTETQLARGGIDRIGGTEKTFCCFNASARDYARIGLMLNNNGQVGAKQIVPAAWIKRISTPVVTLDYGWKYGAQVWHPFPGISMALGLHGQFIFIDPASRTVIVKLSDNPTGSDNEEPTAQVLYAIAQSKI